jgi:DNA-directed RNA polymerase subunit omega
MSDTDATTWSHHISRSAVIATIDDLLSKVDSKYTLVHLAAQRAREINDYYHSLGEGLGQYTPPLVEQVDSNKPLSIALEEIAVEKIVAQYPGDARRVAEELLGSEGGTDAEIFTLTETGGDEMDGLDTETVTATPVDPTPVDAEPVDVEAVDESTDASPED